jgi:hypothetical protein
VHPAISAPLPPTSSAPSVPQEGKGAALILPACNTEAMNLHLVEIAKTIAPAAHAILLVDQAGWQLSTRLVVPPNITIIALPPKSPELTQSKTSGSSCATTGYRTASSNPTTTSSITAAWNKLVDQPWRIMSIGLRQWAHQF